MASSSSSPEISSATPTEPLPRFSYKDASQEEVLEDLSSRFILNLPDEELVSLERLCFQVEQAHWFYEDFIREENTKLPSLPLKRFSEMLFHACPLLQQWSHDHEQAFNTFMQYKTRVPVCGAIMLNDAMDKCVLVKGWKASAGWGFPRGKINEIEPPPTCAIREVLEETGYNLAGQLNPDDVIELSIKEQKISLFVVPGVPEDFAFKTKTRKEISKIEWFRLTDLPTWKKNKATPGRFYLIAPFMGRLKSFINDHKRRNNTPRKNGKQKKSQPAASRMPQMNGTASRDHDTIQESSSQSSSVENIGPHTPSPQQPEPSINPTVTDVELDPQLARLFSSLTMSVMSPTENAVSAKISNEIVVDSQPFDSSSSEASVDSPLARHAHEQPDWSSSAPPHYSPPMDFVSRSTISSVKPPQTAIPTESLRPSVNGSGNHADQNISNSRTATSSPLPVAVSPTSRRKSSSTADISPYLARATVPTSGKLLQQLSLLEAVADESARMAPVIAARAAMASRGSLANVYPMPPPSVPPQPMPARDMGVNYSYHPGVPSSAAGFHPRYPVENPINSYQDPFQVRPRTSQAFQRVVPMHHHNPSGSVGLNQNHLLATINGARGGPISPNYQMGPQFMHQQQPQMFNSNPSLYGTPNHAQHQPAPLPSLPMHGYSTFHLNPLLPSPPPPTGIRPYSTVNHNVMPGMNIAPPNASNTTSLALLSILNGRPSQQAAFPAPAQQ